MNRDCPGEVALVDGWRIGQARFSLRRQGAAWVLVLLAAGGFIGAATYRVVLEAQSVPALAAGSGRAGDPLVQAPQDGFAAVARAVMPAP